MSLLQVPMVVTPNSISDYDQLLMKNPLMWVCLITEQSISCQSALLIPSAPFEVYKCVMDLISALPSQDHTRVFITNDYNDSTLSHRVLVNLTYPYGNSRSFIHRSNSDQTYSLYLLLVLPLKTLKNTRLER